MIAHLYEPARPELVRGQARELVRNARAAGHPVAILTNDLRAFHSQRWVDEIEIVGDVDVLVDGSVEGYLKPDPRLYEILADRLGVDFGDMVFLDDQMTNIRGAEALSIPSVWFDPAQPDTGFAAVRILLGLREEERNG
jgi:putative hydrolase of the HAD superfamily